MEFMLRPSARGRCLARDSYSIWLLVSVFRLSKVWVPPKLLMLNFNLCYGFYTILYCCRSLLIKRINYEESVYSGHVLTMYAALVQYKTYLLIKQTNMYVAVYIVLICKCVVSASFLVKHNIIIENLKWKLYEQVLHWCFIPSHLLFHICFSIPEKKKITCPSIFVLCCFVTTFKKQLTKQCVPFTHFIKFACFIILSEVNSITFSYLFLVSTRVCMSISNCFILLTYTEPLLATPLPFILLLNLNAWGKGVL